MLGQRCSYIKTLWKEYKLRNFIWATQQKRNVNIKEEKDTDLVIQTSLRVTGEKIPLYKMQDDTSSQNTGVLKEKNKVTYFLLRTDWYDSSVESTGYKVGLCATPNKILFIKLSAQNDWRIPYQRHRKKALSFYRMRYELRLYMPLTVF